LRFGVWCSGDWFEVWCLVFGVWGLEFGVWGSGFRFWCLVFGVWGLWFEIWGLGFGVRGMRSGVWGVGVGSSVEGLGFGVWSSGFQIWGREVGVGRFCGLGFGVLVLEGLQPHLESLVAEDTFPERTVSNRD